MYTLMSLITLELLFAPNTNFLGLIFLVGHQINILQDCFED
jgi:hypothetical protein